MQRIALMDYGGGGGEREIGRQRWREDWVSSLWTQANSNHHDHFGGQVGRSSSQSSRKAPVVSFGNSQMCLPVLHSDSGLIRISRNSTCF